MKPLLESMGRRTMAVLTAAGDNAYLSAVRTGMVTIVPLTILGGLFMALAFLPIPGYEERIKGWLPLLDIPVQATFGMLAVLACLAVASDLAQRLKLEPLPASVTAVVAFLLLQLKPGGEGLVMQGLGSAGLFTAILVALVSVRVQRLFSDLGLVIRLPASVPPVVQESFLSLVPFVVLVSGFWILRHLLGVDVQGVVAAAFKPLVSSLDTLPGIMAYAFAVTLLWSVGVNGDNTMDAIVAPVFLQYLADNVAALKAGQPMPHATANGFFTTFVNVGGTGATLALALVLVRSRDAGFRAVSRMSLPTQVFQINEPIFFGLPVVLNPLLMVPYILNALMLTAGSYLLMDIGWIRKPFVSVPWTTPPVIGHYLMTGGDWRAAAWGAASIGLAMVVYYPFARAAERQRLGAAGVRP